MIESLLGSASPIAVVRSSLIPTFVDCQRRWAAIFFWPYGYELHSTPPHVGLLSGKAVHKGAEKTLVEFMRGGTLPKARMSIETALDSWLDAERTNRRDIIYDNTTGDSGEAEAAVRNMAEAAHEAIDPHDPPVMVEAGLEARTPSGDLVVTSTVDLFLQSARLKDRKTGVNRPNGYVQMGTQSLVLRANGHPVAGLDFDYIPRRKRKAAAELMPLDREAAEQLTRETLSNMSRAVRLYKETGDPAVFQANPGSYLCDPRYCPAFGSTFCAAWKLKPPKRKTTR